MTELKTRPNQRSVATFLAGIRNPEQRRDARAVAAMMSAETGSQPRLVRESVRALKATEARP